MASTETINTTLIGKKIDELDTPALLLDGPALQRNLSRMANHFRGKACQLRPHFKNHKCTTLSRRQLEAGSAVGVTCAKLSEAQVLAEAGFDDILIANQVVSAPKLQRLAELGGQVNLTVAVDEIEPAQAMAQAAVQAGHTFGVLIEVDTQMKRCGVDPGEPTLELAKRIMDLKGIEFRGFQAFEGHVVYTNDFDERKRMTLAGMGPVIDTRDLLEQHGISVSTISGGSTATYAITSEIEGITEMQCGTYPTMDWRYQQMTPEFEIALTVLATVISRPRAGMAVLDVGIKGVGAEFGPPKIVGHPDTDIPSFGSEEHAVVQHAPDTSIWPVGHTVQLVSSHACTTCNLHRQMHVHQDGRIVDVWAIEGSGKLT